MIQEEIILEPEQKDLLCKFIEAERDIPKGQRNKFTAIQEKDKIDTEFLYLGGENITFRASLTDAEILAKNGLLEISYGSTGNKLFYATPLGLQYYRELKNANAPSESIEKEIKGYLISDSFKQKYPEAYKKLSKAESLLWESDTSSQYTTIGHICRETLQQFVDSLIKEYNPPDVDTDKAHTVSRVKSVLKRYENSFGSTEKKFLKKLVGYWEIVNELVQRQEHGGQREKEELTWNDSRRVVFHTMIVMYEIDKSLNCMK